MERTKIGNSGEQLKFGLERQPETAAELIGCLALLREEAHDFALGMGLRMMQAFMEAESTIKAGSAHSHGTAINRWGSQPGYVFVGGKKVRTKRPRLRHDEGEVTLETYERFQDPSGRSESILAHAMRGVSARNYQGAVGGMARGYGISKSVVSRSVVAATAQEVKEFCERSLADITLVVLMIDGVRLGGTVFIVALGIDTAGTKHILGFRAGETENTTVTKALITDLAERGLKTDGEILAVLDGAKALSAAVKAHWGERALIQRCQIHKRRNVLDHLPEEHQIDIGRQLDAAYGMRAYADAKAALVKLTRTLETMNHNAAASLREGMEQILTIHRLMLPDLLHSVLRSTNMIESVFSHAQTTLERVKRWRSDDHKRRWLAASLRETEKRLHKIKGYDDIPTLIKRINIAVNSTEPITEQLP
jgi:putative transposase